MLTKEEKDFMAYWETNRMQKKKFLRQFSVGLPVGVLLVGAVFVNLLSGWYKKADMIIRSNSSILITILIALVGIAIFFTIFSSNHKWEQNEQRYLELKAKESKEAELK
jgi:ATP/ADP translocase